MNRVCHAKLVHGVHVEEDVDDAGGLEKSDRVLDT